MKDIIVSLMLWAGAAFTLLGALGTLRMPDLYTRLQASTKAGTLGVTCIMVAAAIHFMELAVAVRALLVVAFLFLTAPVAAHIIARAAHYIRVPLWERNVIDELGDTRRKPLSPSSPPEPGVPGHGSGSTRG
ncbi:MAG: monovalent cation/H(+) antiporter subunit G [Phycisphaeraceae bacterium]|nr:monovalent cation/H(+) antiporter subunit G [Phycisphaeraceae bacterium]